MMELQDYSRVGGEKDGNPEVAVGDYDPGFNNHGYLRDQGNSPPQPGYYGPPQAANHPASLPPSAGYNYPPVGFKDNGGSIDQAPKVVMQNSPRSRPSDYIIIAIVTTVIFNPLIGGLALWFSLQSRHASDKDDFYTGAKRGRDALWLSIGGITSGLVILFSALIILYTQGLARQSQEVQTFSNVGPST